jgi:hypothetical protein
MDPAYVWPSALQIHGQIPNYLPDDSCLFVLYGAS